MKSSPIPRLVIFAAAIAASLVVTFSALGATRPDDRSGARGPGAGTAANAFGGALVHQLGLSARPNDRAGALGVGR
jgi:hypothetical protein